MHSYPGIIMYFNTCFRTERPGFFLHALFTDYGMRICRINQYDFMGNKDIVMKTVVRYLIGSGFGITGYEKLFY